MTSWLYTAELWKPPSPNEGPTLKLLNNPKIQEEVMSALKKAGMNINIASVEIYHQNSKLYIKTKEGFNIEFRSGEHYIWKGNKLTFITSSIIYIQTELIKYNKAAAELKKHFHFQLDPSSM